MACSSRVRLSACSGDARLLRRLLRNLLENARRHGAPPAHVRIARAAETAIVTVWDSGPGVPRSEFEKVFRPFYRPTGAGNSTGTGLGLRWYGKSHAAMAAKRTAKLWRADAAVLS